MMHGNDFQAHRIYTVDLNVNRCTTQQYVSAYAPVMHDPIGGAEEMAARAGSLKTISRESVNGIPARVVEAPLEGWRGSPMERRIRHHQAGLRQLRRGQVQQQLRPEPELGKCGKRDGGTLPV
jgi:hypothetical protein